MNFNLRSRRLHARARQRLLRPDRRAGRRRSPACAARPSRRAPPLAGGFARSVFPEGADTTTRDRILVQVNTVGLGYFQTIGIPIVRGRDFTRADTATAPKVVVVNETMAQQFWKGEEALGKRFKFFGDAGLHHGHRRRARQQVQRRGRGAAAVHLPAARAELHAGRRRCTSATAGDAASLAAPCARDVAAARSDALGLRRAHARGAGRPVAAAAEDERGPADRVRRAGAAAGLDRAVRRRELLGLAAHARDRRAHGARRAAVERARPRARPRHDPGRRRAWRSAWSSRTSQPG